MEHTEPAIKNYERSVELNPQNKNGIEQLKKLKGKQGAAACPRPDP